MILVDAGPLIALLLRDEAQHGTCVRTLESLDEPLVTVWPAVTEAAYMVRGASVARDALLGWVEDGILGLAALGAGDMPRVRELLRKYADLPMDFADAALVAVAEREGIRTVFTLDRRDFELYRPRKLGRFRIVP